MSTLIVLALAAAKSMLLLGLAAGIARTLRGASARVRSLVWATAICGSLMVPVLAAVGPSVEIALPLPTLPAPPVPSAGADAAADPGSPMSVASHSPRVARSAPGPRPLAAIARPWPEVAIGAWLVGALVVLLRQALGWWRAAAAVRRGRPLDDREWLACLDHARRRVGCRRTVALLASPELTVPATLGVAAPVVMLPEHSRHWVADRRDAVLLHELVHVARGDWAVRTLARLAVAVYWFNPLAWWAVRRLELEQELACDEAVLGLGERPADYAGHLLGIAHLAGRRRTCAIPVAGMARRHDVEERIMAILDRPHTRPATRTTLAAAVVAVAALVPIVAAVQPESRVASTELVQALADLREVEARLEPLHARLEDAAAGIEREVEGLEPVELVDEQAMLAIEREMEPYLERIAEIEVDMAPYEEQIEEIGRTVESLEIDLERGTIDDLHRQIEEQLKPHLARLEQLQVDLEPMHERLAELHRELEPLHERLAAVHEEIAPRDELIAHLHERLEPMQRAMEAMHAEMEPLHRELEAKARRVETALAAEVEAALRQRLGAVVAAAAPWSETAARIVDEGSLHVDEDGVRLDVSRSEVREILTDLLAPHRVGTGEAFTATLEETVREISHFEVEVP